MVSAWDQDVGLVSCGKATEATGDEKVRAPCDLSTKEPFPQGEARSIHGLVT